MATRWCSNCTKISEVATTHVGLICCIGCGKVVGENFFIDEPTFVKNAAGQSRLAGNIVRSVDTGYSASRSRTIQTALDRMENIVEALDISGRESIFTPARRFYELALDLNFTRGRKSEQVAAACLYIACREQKKPFLLIEFSDSLGVNVYELGGVFLQLCKVLNLEEHPIVQMPVDPSLFMHRFAGKFVNDQGVEHLRDEISNSALSIMKSMKRDWMQTGRKPSGLCGAALYISALSHGINVSKSEIVKQVHICEATLTKRLVEFETTDSGSLTIEELDQRAKEWGKISGCVEPREGELLCEHKNDGSAHFSHGLCAKCYNEFMELSGGLDSGAEPPAFQRAERARLAQSCPDKNTATPCISPGLVPIGSGDQEPDDESSILHTGGCEKSKTSEFGIFRGYAEELETPNGANDEFFEADSANKDCGDESETLSDVDDNEVNHYLHTEEEKIWKKRIWETLNKDYLEEQAAKEAAAAAAREANLASFQGCSEEDLARRDLAAQTSAALTQSRKEKRERRAAEAKKPRTAAEATRSVLTQKGLSSKINYEKLDEIFDSPFPTDIGGKKSYQNSEDEDEVDHHRDVTGGNDYSYYGNQGEDVYDYEF